MKFGKFINATETIKLQMLGLSGSHELEAESKVGRSRDLSDAKSGVNQLGIKIASGIFD